MADVQIMAGDLTASLEDRVVSGLLLPYGEIGRTNLGRFEIEGPGIISIPKDLSVLTANEEHSQVEPRARFLTATDTAAGIVASFKIGENEECDTLLAKIDDRRKAGKPMALSVEVKDMVIKAGKAIAGKLTGAAFVDRGAFPSATLMAAEFDDEPPTEAAPVTSSPLAPVDGVIAIEATETPDSVDVHVGEDTTSYTPKETENTVLPNTLTASVSAEAPTQPGYREMRYIMGEIAGGRANDVMLARLNGQFQNQGTLFAALNDVTYDEVGSPKPYNVVPQWIGELWTGLQYVQTVADLISHKDLTSKTINGFKWTTKPTGATWEGNKNDVPSNAPATSPFTEEAELFAGGHDIAIEHRLFSTPGYFEAYWEAMGESYLRWVDTKVVTDLLAGATEVEADDPAGLDIGDGLSAIIDGAVAVVTANALPTFALVHPTLYKSILKIPTQSVIGYLNAALNFKQGDLEGFVIRPHASLDAGNVLVGARDAATLYELPGVPVRIEAPDTVKGGIDTNMFGAAAVTINKADALQLVTPYAA